MRVIYSWQRARSRRTLVNLTSPAEVVAHCRSVVARHSGACARLRQCSLHPRHRDMGDHECPNPSKASRGQLASADRARRVKLPPDHARSLHNSALQLPKAAHHGQAHLDRLPCHMRTMIIFEGIRACRNTWPRQLVRDQCCCKSTSLLWVSRHHAMACPWRHEHVRR